MDLGNTAQDTSSSKEWQDIPQDKKSILRKDPSQTGVDSPDRALDTSEVAGVNNLDRSIPGNPVGIQEAAHGYKNRDGNDPGSNVKVEGELDTHVESKAADMVEVLDNQLEGTEEDRLEDSFEDSLQQDTLGTLPQAPSALDSYSSSLPLWQIFRGDLCFCGLPTLPFNFSGGSAISKALDRKHDCHP
eukprot:c20718_g1_i1 orf=45-608(-)